MFFDSVVYFLFLTLVVGLYWKLPHRAQNFLLLVASYFFYGWWDWRFLLLMAVSTVVDFLCARGIDAAKDGRRRKVLLSISLVLNFTFLGFFKYFNFFAESFTALLGSLGLHGSSIGLLRILLPPGISIPSRKLRILSTFTAAK